MYIYIYIYIYMMARGVPVLLVKAGLGVVAALGEALDARPRPVRLFVYVTVSMCNRVVGWR